MVEWKLSFLSIEMQQIKGNEMELKPKFRPKMNNIIIKIMFVFVHTMLCSDKKSILLIGPPCEIT